MTTVHFSPKNVPKTFYLIKKHVTNKSILACFNSMCELTWVLLSCFNPYQGCSCRQPCVVMVLFPIPWSRPVSVRQSGLAHGGFTMWNPMPRCFLNPICSLCAWEPHHGVTHCCFAACTGMGSMGETVKTWTIRFQNEIKKNMAGVILTFIWTQENSTYYILRDIISLTVDLYSLSLFGIRPKFSVLKSLVISTTKKSRHALTRTVCILCILGEC